MVWAPGSSQNGVGYTDELVQVRVNNNLDDPMMSQTMLPLDYPMEMYPGDHWVMQDANYNVLGLVDRDGKMVERYEYSPYGERKVFVSAGSNDPGCYAPTLVSWRRTMYTMVGGMYDNPVSVPDQPFGLCEFGHQGLPHEEEIDNGSMIQNRMRIRRGERWYQRDPWQKDRSRHTAGDGYQDGMNMYQYIQNNPFYWIDSSGECKIEVRYNKLGGFWKLSYYHAYIVVTDIDGTITYYRAGPMGNGPSQSSGGSSASSAGTGGISSGSGGSSSGSSGSQSSGSGSSNTTSPGSADGGTGGTFGPWGPITSESGSYTPGTIDWNPGTPPSVVVLNDDEPCKCKKNLQEYFMALNNAMIPYNPFIQNSNSAAHDAIERLGYPRPQPPVWAPASATKLPVMPQHYPVNSSNYQRQE